MVDHEPEFGRVRSSVFPDLSLGSAEQVQSLGFMRDSSGLEVPFLWTNHYKLALVPNSKLDECFNTFFEALLEGFHKN